MRWETQQPMQELDHQIGNSANNEPDEKVLFCFVHLMSNSRFAFPCKSIFRGLCQRSPVLGAVGVLPTSIGRVTLLRYGRLWVMTKLLMRSSVAS